MRVFIASNFSYGRTLTIDTPEEVDPVKIAYELGRAESGETVQIWTDGNSDALSPDYAAYWDEIHRGYRRCSEWNL